MNDNHLDQIDPTDPSLSGGGGRWRPLAGLGRLLDRVVPRDRRLQAVVGGLLVAAGVASLIVENAQLQARLDGGEKTTVVLAKGDMEPGQVLQASDVVQVRLDASSVHGKAIRAADLDLILGRRLGEGVFANESLLWSSLLPESAGESRLAGMVRMGERAVAIRVDGIASVGFFVQPGDRVDLFLATRQASGRVVMPVLQNVSVLAVGDALIGEASSRQGYDRMVVSVTPREAEMLLLAQQAGTIHLLLRNEADVTAEAEFPVLHEREFIGGEVRREIQTHRNQRIKIIKGSG